MKEKNRVGRPRTTPKQSKKCKKANILTVYSKRRKNNKIANNSTND